MSKLLDSSYNNMVFSNGDEVTTPTSGKSPEAMNATSETYIATNGLNSKVEINRIRRFDRWLYNSSEIDYTKILRLWPIIYKYSTNSLNAYIGSTKMVASGDYTEDRTGINGGATTYFDTGVNSSAIISDINNFSIFLGVYDNTNVGFDIGGSDGTNHVKFAARDSGNTKVQIGTASEVFSNSDSTGIWCVNCRGGSFYIYQNGVEVGGGGTSIAGSLPNYNIYLGANNDTGSPSDYTLRTYNHLTIYNGALSENGVQEMSANIHQIISNG